MYVAIIYLCVATVAPDDCRIDPRQRNVLSILRAPNIMMCQRAQQMIPASLSSELPSNTYVKVDCRPVQPKRYDGVE